jgi:hypothetical protein
LVFCKGIAKISFSAEIPLAIAMALLLLYVKKAKIPLPSLAVLRLKVSNFAAFYF